MKKIRYIISAVAVMAAFTSCDSFLNTLPDNRTQIDSEEKVKELLVNAYPNAYGAMIAELSSDNTDDNGNAWQSYNQLQTQAATWQDVTVKDLSDDPYSIWNACYKAIACDNEALQAIENLGNPSSLNPQKGEALLSRAYNHFILANLFCLAYSPKTSKTDLGIPYMTKPETTVAPYYSRGTVQEVYEHIQKDIEEGIPLLDDGAYSLPAYHFNKKAAYAFAARFYLYFMQDDKSNLDKSIAYANEVLGSNPSQVLCDWPAMRQAQGGNGNMLPNEFCSTDNTANLLILSASSEWPVVYGPYGVGEKYCFNNKIAETEAVKAPGPWGSFYLETPQYGDLIKVIMFKMGYYFEYTDPVNQIGYSHTLFPVFTTDKTLLDRAEAYVLKGNFQAALADMNTFTHAFSSGAPTITDALLDEYYGAAAPYYTPTSPTPKKKLDPDFSIPSGGEKYIHAVLNLRRVLTIHEGNRWEDIKRYGIEIYRRLVFNGSGAITVLDALPKNDPRRAIQLPQEVITAGLEANPRNK